MNFYSYIVRCKPISLIRLIGLGVFILLGCWSSQSFGQEIFLKEELFSTDDGLPHREVNTIIQCSEGFIWVGTPQGIARFDGRSFETHNIFTDSFLHNNIWRILEDADGWFWLLPIPPFDDFDIWHPQTGQRTTYSQKFPDLLVPIAHPAEWIRATNDHTLYASFDANHLFSYHPDRGVELIKLEGDFLESEPREGERQSLIAANDQIWFMTTDNRLLQVDRNGRELQNFTHDQNVYFDRSLNSRRLPFVYTEGDGASKKKAFLVNEFGERKELGQTYYYPTLIPAERLPELDELIIFDDFSFYEDGKEAFFTMSPGRDVPNPDIEKRADLNGIDGSAFRCLYYDTRGNLWVGGNFGLHKLSFKKNNFRNYLFDTSTDSREWKATRSIFVDENRLLINQEHGGPVVVDLASSRTKKWLETIQHFGFTAIEKYAEESIAVGSFSGVYLFGIEGGLKSYISADFQTWAIYPLSKRQLLLGTNKGLRILELGTFTTKPYDLVGAFPEINTAHILHIHRDKRGQLWMATTKGLYQTDNEGKIIARYGRNGAPTHYFPSDIIYHFHEEESKEGEQSFWVATGGDGLVHLKIGPGKDNVTFNQYTKANGLANDVIYAVYPDINGQLWLSSDKGIICFNKQTKETHNFLEQDGITNNEFNRISHFQTEDGMIYFGGLNGVTSFCPDEVDVGQYLPDLPVKVLGFQQFDGQSGVMEDRTTQLLSENKIELQPKDHSFSLKVALLNYEDAAQHNYAWRLEGLEKEWNYTNDAELKFGRLPYGNYQLQVKAQDARGAWSSKVLEVPIIVLKPLYLQTWFLLLMGLVLLVITFAWISYRTSALKKRQKELELIVAERTRELREDKQTIEEQAKDLQALERLKSRFFANVSHELRTPLTLLLGPVAALLKRSYWQDKDRQQLNIIQRNAQQLLKLVNEILDLSKLEDNRLEVALQEVEMITFLQRIATLFKSYGDENEVELSLELERNEQLVVLLDREKVEKIIYNYLSNAFKFTPRGGSIVLKLQEEPAALLISITDTGLGIHKKDLPRIFDRFYQAKYSAQATQGGTGIGLSLVRNWPR